MANLPAENHTPQVGDIWKEVDSRIERYVRVERVGVGRRSITIRTVVFNPSNMGRRWRDAPRTRATYADLGRFNGRRNGYKLHERGVLADALP